MWHSCNVIKISNPEMTVEVGVGVNVKVNRTGQYDGLYAMGSLGGALGLLKGKYLCKVKLENYNSSPLGNSSDMNGYPMFVGVDEYIGDSRTILEVYDIEEIVNQIIEDYGPMNKSFTQYNDVNYPYKYHLLPYLIWVYKVSPFELVSKYFGHLIEKDQEVY